MAPRNTRVQANVAATQVAVKSVVFKRLNGCQQVTTSESIDSRPTTSKKPQ